MTLDEITAAVAAVEAQADQVRAFGMLKARLAGAKSAIASFGVAVDTSALDAQIDVALAAKKSDILGGK